MSDLGQAKNVKAAFTAQRQFLLASTKAKKPDIPTWMDILQDLQKAMQEAESAKTTSREASLRNPIQMVADGVGALGWVTLDESQGQKPHEQILELLGGAQMYGNKVLREFKDKYDWQSFQLAFSLTNPGQRDPTTLSG
jgi:adenylyl cyclase-associated protein